MKYLLSVFSITLFLCFSSCDKDESQEDKIEISDGQRKCIELVYPVVYEMPDGSEITADSKEVIHRLIKNWYTEHPDVAAKPSLKYPVQVIFAGHDAILDIENEEQMIKLKKKCRDNNIENDRPRKCIDLVYPVVYEMPDGSKITADTKNAIRKLIKNWYTEHPDVAAKPSLQYPVQVIFAGHDAILDIENEEQMIELKKKCKDN